MDIPHLSHFYEPSTTKLILENSPQKFIDVGAHVGRYSILAASRGSDVISFEPSTNNFKQFLSNIELNSLKSKIRPLKIGLSNKSGKRRFFFIPLQEGLSSFIEHENSLTEKVNVDKMDNVLHKYKVNIGQIDIIKIDTEGTELNILKGATNTLSKGNATLIIEILESKLKLNIFSFLKGFEYECKNVLDGRNYVFKKTTRSQYH